MGKQRKKTHRHVTETARSVIEHDIGEKLTGEPPPEPEKSDKPDTRNPAAVDLSKLGASKGGKARADKLSPKKRSQIAQRPPKTRWKQRKSRLLTTVNL